MNEIDKNVKGLDENETVRIIICKKIISMLLIIVVIKEFFQNNMN